MSDPIALLADADGLALLLLAGAAGFWILMAALIVEAILARGMRWRRRRRERMARYLASIGRDSWPGATQ